MKADSHFTFSTECGKMILRRGDLSPLFLLERLYQFCYG
nr:MAG TPA: agnoprotein [Caudoviricetes sp.]